MAILVTGGTGYIGSHTVVELLNNGYDVVIVDNYINSKPEVLNRINKITGKSPRFYEVDVCDYEKLKAVFQKEKITDIIHFAGLKSVAESVQKPQLYFDNNVGSSKVLLRLMDEFKVTNLVFSSSATVYGVPEHVPLKETDKVGGCTNPYGQTKLDIEYLLKDYAKVHKEANIAILRYFNPIGAHESGLIGEDPNGIPNNLMPYITQVAVGKRPHLNVYGNDYKTVDGTGVRDYIHVVDLAHGHLCASSLSVLMSLPVESSPTTVVSGMSGCWISSFSHDCNVNPAARTSRMIGDLYILPLVLDTRTVPKSKDDAVNASGRCRSAVFFLSLLFI